MLVRRFCVLQVLSCTWLRTRFWQRRALLIASAAQRSAAQQTQPITRCQALKSEKSKPRRVQAAVLASRPRRAESENRFNFRERAETSTRDSEPRPRMAPRCSARLGSSRSSRSCSGPQAPQEYGLLIGQRLVIDQTEGRIFSGCAGA